MEGNMRYQVKERRAEKAVEYLTVGGLNASSNRLTQKLKGGVGNSHALTAVQRCQSAGTYRRYTYVSQGYKTILHRAVRKGGKERVLVPLDEPMMNLLTAYMEENGLNKPGMDHHPLFFNSEARAYEPGHHLYTKEIR